MDNQPKKKRGRKPKPKSEESKKSTPKKRGRKPKNNTIVNDNPTFDGNYDEDITVILNNTINENSKSNDKLNCYDSDIIYQNISENNQSTVSKICWNCSYNLETNIVCMPVKFLNNIFYTYGDFCSDSCCLRYSYDNYNDSMYYEVKSNIACRNKINNIDIDVKLPPSKFTLEIYGGILKREDYINCDKDYTIDLTKSIHINHNFLQNENKIINSFNLENDLKIYRRKKDPFKNNINKLLNTN